MVKIFAVKIIFQKKSIYVIMSALDSLLFCYIKVKYSQAQCLVTHQDIPFCTSNSGCTHFNLSSQCTLLQES